MGVYLSSPVTDKDSVDEKCSDFVYGASSMQGWRISQEDAHNCIPNFYDKTSFFAVYDGHGGAEVAKYCEKHFPDFVKKLIEKNGFGDDIKTFIQSAFLEFDATLTEDDVIKELKVLAGKDDDNEEEEEGDPVGRTETDMLKEEANMPLDQLLAQYNTSPKNEIKNLNKKDFKSPFLTGRSKPLKSLKNEDENGDISSQTVSSTSNAAIEDAEAPSLPNGIENLNNSNSQCSHLESANIATHDSQKDSKMENNNDQPSPALDNKKEAETCSNSNAEVSSSKCESSSQPVGSSIEAGGSSSSAEPSGSGSSCPGIKKSKTKAATEMATLDGDIETSDDDEDEDEEDLWEDMSDDDEDEDDEDEDEGQDDDVPIMDMSNDEPGSDSGCTACVCLLHEKKLIVANAGDSRCVLSRAGMAVELSFDHKPEDDAERARIQNAGGRVTSDGRVNGGLNLSRAIGDHVYKQNKDLPDRDQMITALPDVEIAELCEDDQFFVIACDGIWNYMSSQEVVDYILDKLKDPKKREKPSLICEELFDHCLAPNTYGDGTGCDNMTCIIVVFNNFKPSDTVKRSPLTTADTLRSTKKEMDVELQGDSCSSNAPEQACAGSIKRCSDNLEVNEGKRIKLGGEELF